MRWTIGRTLAASMLPFVAAACSQQPQAPAPATPEVGVVTLQEQDAGIETLLPGRVVALETSEVRPQVNGIIRRRLFEEGALVSAGQVLYEIEDAPYRAALASAQGNLAMASASIRSTRLQADRYGRLLAVKGVSQQDYDNADAAARQAAATVQARRADVMSANVSLGFTRIRAPISGRIGRSLLTVGALAQTGQADPLATISKISEVYVDVTESADKLLNLKDAIRAGGVSRDGASTVAVQLVLPNGKTYPLQGKLAFTDTTVDPSSGSVTIRARFPNPDGTLLPGMYVSAKIVQGVRHNAILVPQQGVSHDAHGDAVALVLGSDGKVAERKLVLGTALGDKWIVDSGLKAGDRVIVEGLQQVKPGDAAKAAAPQQSMAAPGQGARPELGKE